MIVAKKVSFDAAHFLPNYEGKCKNVHGHHWEVELAVEGPVDRKTGMVIDFSELDLFLKDLIVGRFDHKLINDEVKNPTAENILSLVKKLWEGWSFTSVKLKWIKVWESEDSYVQLGD